MTKSTALPILVAVVMLVAFAALASTVSAQGKGKRGLKRACAADVQKFCADAEGREAKKACMMEHKEELSDQCREKLGRVKGKRKAIKNACAADVKTFCGDVEPGGGAIRACMKEHKSELSEGCRKAVKAAKKRRGGKE